MEGAKGKVVKGKRERKNRRKGGKNHVKLYKDCQCHKRGTFSLLCFKLENFPPGGERLRANVKAIFKNVKGCFEKERLELVCVI